MNLEAIARQSAQAGHNTINTRTVSVYFQRYAGTNAASGIAGLEYRVMNPDGSIAQRGQTRGDGRVRVRLTHGMIANLEILGSVYEIGPMDRPLHPIDELRGVQERLNMLGYNAGELINNGQMVEGRDSHHVGGMNHNQETERAVLNFQVDNDFFANARIYPEMLTVLRRVLERSGGE